MPETITDNLQATIESAVTEYEKTLEQSQDDKKAPEAKTEEPKKEAVETKEEDDPTELANAKELYRALKDPEKAPGIIEFIAKQAGYTKLETKAEVKEAKKDITDILKGKLGDSFDFMTPQLAAAIKEYVESEFEEREKETRSKLEQIEKERLETQYTKSLTKLTNSFFGEGETLPKAVQDGMSQYMDRIPPTADLSISDYLSDAFYATIGRLGLTKPQKVDATKETKTNKNRTDAASRLASDRSNTAVGQPVPDTSKIETRRQAIQAAMEQINKEN